MDEKYSIKALKEKDGLGGITWTIVKKWAIIRGVMTPDGVITESGKSYLEFRTKKAGGWTYLAATEKFAREAMAAERAEIVNKIKPVMNSGVKIIEKTELVAKSTNANSQKLTPVKKAPLVEISRFPSSVITAISNIDCKKLKIAGGIGAGAGAALGLYKYYKYLKRKAVEKEEHFEEMMETCDLSECVVQP